MEQTKELKTTNKVFRIPGKEAVTYELPNHNWEMHWSRDILTKVGEKLRKQVPLNEDLLANVRQEGIKNPIMLGHDMWPWVGSQRLRCLQVLWDSERINTPLLVCRIVGNPLKIWNMYGSTDARKVAAMNVQLWEIVFKSLYYGSHVTDSGKDMYKFEEEGDKMYWSIRDDSTYWNKKKLTY